MTKTRLMNPHQRLPQNPRMLKLRRWLNVYPTNMTECPMYVHILLVTVDLSANKWIKCLFSWCMRILVEQADSLWPSDEETEAKEEKRPADSLDHPAEWPRNTVWALCSFPFLAPSSFSPGSIRCGVGCMSSNCSGPLTLALLPPVCSASLAVFGWHSFVISPATWMPCVLTIPWKTSSLPHRFLFSSYNQLKSLDFFSYMLVAA